MKTNKDKAIQIRNNLEIDKILYNDFDTEVAIGDYIIDTDANRNYKIVDIYLKPKMEYDRTKKKSVETDEMEVMIEGDEMEVMIEGDEMEVMIEGEPIGDTEHRQNTTYDMEQWRSYSYSFFRGNLDDLKKKVLQYITTDKPEDKEIEMSKSTEVAVIDKNLLRQQKSKAIHMRNRGLAKHAILKGIMESKMYQLRVIKDKFDMVISRINKVIYTLEIYLGVNEDVVQIQEGQNASADTPIYFRQKLLYMDTEIADPYQEGIDFRRIEEFDDWLLAENPYYKIPNYKVSIPEEKCVVAFRIRKHKKHVDGIHPLVQAQEDQLNMKTYIFIRNGTNIYKIWADINIFPRLFPQRDEFIKKLDHWQEKDKEDNIFKYKLQILLMQGLIERTPIFHPLTKNINLFDPMIHKSNIVKFIYDDEASLTDGTITYKDWKKKVNDNIKPGSRIIIAGYVGTPGYTNSEFVDERLWKVYYAGTFNVPPAPDSGIYTVYEDIDNRRAYNRKEGEVRYCLKIMYNPADEVCDSWDWGDPGHTRKNRLSFLIYSGDDFVIHWDGISRKDIDMLEAMIWDRRNREDYLSVMTSLIKIIELKKKEIVQEDNFIKLVYGMNMTIFNEYNIMEKSAIKLIKDAVEWWKLKNKWKRSLDTDDSKALKMISKRVLVPDRLKNYKRR